MAPDWLCLILPGCVLQPRSVPPALRSSHRIFDLSAPDKDDLSLAMAGIDKFQDFLSAIGCPTHLSELGIGDELFSRYAEDAVLVVHDENGNLPGRPPMSKKDIVEVLTTAL